jgi:hypothetical protein
MNALIGIGTGAGAILIAALVLGVFRALLTLRDNTKAVQELTTSMNEWKATISTAHEQLTARVKNLEDWRIALEAATHAERIRQ